MTRALAHLLVSYTDFHLNGFPMLFVGNDLEHYPITADLEVIPALVR
jgi:hypothetical protein